jgi:broad specificity phosphatase PhoE
MAGVVSPQGMPSYDDFVAASPARSTMCARPHRHNVLLVSSGGPIATAVGQVLGTAPR